eukprot:1150117-Pelagomonas_calceolata.AAC.6
MGNFTSTTGKFSDPPPPGSANDASAERSQSSSAASTSGRDECPVLTSSSMQSKGPVYDVYGQNINDPNRKSSNPVLEALKGTNVLDPRNNMPLEPNQLPCPGQRKQLPTERAVSSIPKGGVNGTWTFPSPQMVYNGGQSTCRASSTCMCVSVCVMSSHASNFINHESVCVPSSIIHCIISWQCVVASKSNEQEAALKRKGKGDDVTEDDMEGFVAAHNCE